MKGGKLGRGNNGKLGGVCCDTSFWVEGVEWSVFTESGMGGVDGREEGGEEERRN